LLFPSRACEPRPAKRTHPLLIKELGRNIPINAAVLSTSKPRWHLKRCTLCIVRSGRLLDLFVKGGVGKSADGEGDNGCSFLNAGRPPLSYLAGDAASTRKWGSRRAAHPAMCTLCRPSLFVHLRGQSLCFVHGTRVNPHQVVARQKTIQQCTGYDIGQVTTSNNTIFFILFAS